MSSDLLQGSTNKALFSMSLPISIGMLSTFLFQVIDTYFVGQLGAEALAALSFSSTVYFLLVGLFMGLAVGVSVIVGKAHGASEILGVKQTAISGILICAGLSTLLATVILVLMGGLFSGLGADSSILPLINEYMEPLTASIPLLTVGIMAGAILRATGNVTRPEAIMAIAGVINLVFDYLLIFGKLGFPEMSIAGAAYATVLSWIFVIIGMALLMIKDKLLTLTPGLIQNIPSITSEIFKIGLPTIITQIVGPLTLMYLTFIMARQSSLAVAAFGVASRIETLLMIGILGVSTAITPFIAQNLGAGKHLRIDQAIVFGGRASTYLGVIVSMLLILSIKPIAGLFSQDPGVIEHTSQYFYLISISYIFSGLFLVTSSIFNGLQLPVNSLKINLVKSIVFTLPCTLTGSYFGINGIFVGIALANVLAGLYASHEMQKQFRKANSELANVNLIAEYKTDFRELLKKLEKIITK